MDDASDKQSGPISVAPAADTGLIALCQIARHLGVPANPTMLGRHHLVAGMVASKEDLIRIARRLGLRARLVKTHWDRLAKTPLPAIVLNTDGQFSIVGRVIDEPRRCARPRGLPSRVCWNAQSLRGPGPAS